MPRRSCRRYLPVPPSPRRAPGRGTGFSLVELLVVIGIIAVLIGILIPVVGRMRREAYKVDTAALINTIRSAAESYHANFKAYPGPFTDNEVYGGNIPPGITKTGPVTGAEQLVLSLCGGLKLAGNRVIWNVGSWFDSSAKPPVLITPGGPANLNPRNPKTYPPFISDAAKYIIPTWNGSNSFQDAAGNVGSDTNLPEFVDRYPEPLPILYLRARKGAPGVISNGGDPYQYDLRQITGYTTMNASHGLRELGANVNETAGESVKRKTTDNSGRLTGADAIPYFRAPGMALPSGFGVTSQEGASPRARDGFILISAGPDRLYGTTDDITSFGAIE